jgi:uncharacterized membrane protein YeaQ/YmgE (transglycosylase-associated protein family)
MTDAPYRAAEDRLGAEERESEATRMLGRWRDRLRTRVLIVFALLGLVPAAIGYYVVQELQFQYNDGVANLRINVLAGVVGPWLALMLLGRFVGTRLVERRTPAQLAKLAADYEVPVARLQETASLLKGF